MASACPQAIAPSRVRAAATLCSVELPALADGSLSPTVVIVQTDQCSAAA